MDSDKNLEYPKFEWLNPEFFPDEKAMRELLFDRDMVWALRGLEH